MSFDFCNTPIGVFAWVGKGDILINKYEFPDMLAKHSRHIAL